MKITKGQLRRVIKEELSFSINSDVPRGYLPLRGHQRLFERSYVTGVLGVHMPLNESYPYSHRLYEEILREQFLFEGFWGELLQKGKDKLLDAKEGIKKFGKETWAILAAFYEVVKGGDGEISSFTGSIAKKGINKLFNKIRDTLKWMVAKLPEWDMPTFSDWAQKGLDALDAIQENVNGLGGWKRVIGFAGLAVGLQWLWDKVGGWIDELKEKVGDFGQALADDVIGPIKEWIKETAMEKLKEVGGDAFKKIMTTLASVTSGVKPWWDAAVKVAGGAKLVIDSLGPAASRFMARQGGLKLPGTTSESNTSQGKTMKITKKQLRRIIKEAILQEKKGLWDNVHAKRKRGEKPAKKGDKDYPDEKAWKAAQEADKEEGDDLNEAEYGGRKVKVGKPTAIRKGQTGYGKKQDKVYVKDGPKEDDVKVVRFGDPNSEIRRDNPKAKKNFRSRHNCDNPGPKTKARYWSCKAW